MINDHVLIISPGQRSESSSKSVPPSSGLCHVCETGGGSQQDAASLVDLFQEIRLDFDLTLILFEVNVHLFLIETSLKQKPGHWVKKRHIGRVRCVVSHHVEQPGKKR